MRSSPPLRAPLRRGLAVATVAAFVMMLGCEDDAGPAWSLAIDDSDGAWMNAWGPTADDVLIVGGNPSQAAMLRFDGASFMAGSPPDGAPMLHWVHGWADPADPEGRQLVVVGRDGFAAHRRDGAWTTVPTDVDVDLWGVWVVSPTRWIAVGDAPEGTPSVPTLLEGDATGLALVPLPALDRPSRALYKAWGSSEDDVIVVGAAGVVLEWDGAVWSQRPTGTSADLISVWGHGADVLAVGGRSNGVLARRSAGEWTSTTVPAFAGLNGVWMDARGDATVVGNLGTVAVVPAGTLDANAAPERFTPWVLHGAFGTADGARFGVGGSLDRNPPYRGVIVRRAASDTP
jgi:hypothetical protein